MAYVSRNIEDRIAKGDDIFILEQLDDNRYRLVPSPDEVITEGSIINKALLQPIEDRVVWLMNRFFDPVTTNIFRVEFDTLDGVKVEGVWDKEERNIKC